MTTFNVKMKDKAGNIVEQEISLIPRTRKVVRLTEKLKTKSLSDLLFKGLNEGNVSILAETIKAFAEKQDGTEAFYSIDNVYDFIDNYISENECSYSSLYEEVLKITNEMGFLKAKMAVKELEQNIKNPVIGIDMNEIITNSAKKAVETIATEEFRGFKG